MIKKQKTEPIKKVRTSQADKYPMNIPVETFNVWQQNRRMGDPEAMMKAFKCSRPIVERALNFGHVKEAWVVKSVNDFYKNRLKKELEQSRELLALTKEASQAKAEHLKNKYRPTK